MVSHLMIRTWVQKLGIFNFMDSQNILGIHKTKVGVRSIQIFHGGGTLIPKWYHT
jgi:hypothetical protein